MDYTPTTLEITTVPKPPNFSSITIVPVGADGLCDIGGISPTDTSKTFHDLKPGDSITVNGEQHIVRSIKTLE